MKYLLSVTLCAGLLLCTGCPVTEEVMDPEVSVYGRLKADIAMNTEATLASPASLGDDPTDPTDTVNSAGDFMQLVSNKMEGGDTLAITSRESRLGVKVKMGESITAKAEFDMYGGTVDNKPNPLLRHMFVNMDLGNGMSLLAGQTSDVFSPLLPQIINYGWGWNCGNPGYRRPQFRFALDKSGVQFQLAAARSIDAEAAAMPDIQARLGYKKEKLTAGVSFVQGVTDADGDVTVNGLGVDFNVPIGNMLVLRGEYSQGSNLTPYLAGIGNAVDSAGDEVATTCVWIQVGVKATDKLTVNLGHMYDDPDVLAGDGGPDKNSCTFLNVRCKLNPKTEAVLEASLWSTEYEGDTDYENNRVQASVIYTF